MYFKTKFELHNVEKNNTINLINEFWGEWHDMKIKDPHTQLLAKKVYDYIKNNNIEFKEWEIHIPTYGKSHPQLAFRPSNLIDLDNE